MTLLNLVGSSSFQKGSAVFDGASLSASSITGQSDSNKLTFSAVVKVGAYLPEGETESVFSIVSNASTGDFSSPLFFETTGSVRAIRLRFYRADGTTVAASWQGGSGIIGQNTQYHFAVSFDLSDTAKRHVYINDTEITTGTWSVYTNDTLDLTPSGGFLVARQTLSAQSYSMRCTLAELYYAPDQYLDLSVEANRRKFVKSGGEPVAITGDGSGVTGTAPLVYLSGKGNEFLRNRATGALFTLSGTLGNGGFPTL